MDKLYEFGIHFKPFTLFLIRKKHEGINLYDIDFWSLKGNKVFDPDDGAEEDMVMDDSD